MADKAVKMMLPDGRMVDGFEVDVDESNERWSEIKLQDGARVRVKLTILNAVRAANDYDAQGHPIYSLNMSPVIAVMEVPEKLRKKGH